MPELLEDLEDQVRRSLTRRAAGLPRPGDTAAAALRTADRLRGRHRRRLVLASAAAVLVVALGAVAVVGALGPHRADPGPAASPTAPASANWINGDLRVGRTIRPVGGGSVALPAAVTGTVEAGYRMSAGWLLDVITPQGQARSFLIGRTGTVLWSGPRATAASPDGSSFVWVDQTGRGGLGRIARDGTVATSAVALPPVRHPSEPFTAMVWHGLVVVSYVDLQQAGSGTRLAVWDTGAGTVSAWSMVRAGKLIGASADGRYLLAVTDGAAGVPCVSELDPYHGFAVHASFCRKGINNGVQESPDHRWLVTVQLGTIPARTYELTTMFGPSSAVRDGPACAQRLMLDVVWENDGTYVVVDKDPSTVTATRCQVGSASSHAVPDPRLAPGGGVTVLLDPATLA